MLIEADIDKALQDLLEGKISDTDKKTWGPGPWVDEPDRLEFTAHGYNCLAQRARTTGAWCGYVDIPIDHPMKQAKILDNNLDVHGGITYSRAIDENTYRLGFDCSHLGDYLPWACKLNQTLMSDKLKNYDPFKKGNYKTLEYVKGQCEKLALQLKEIETLKKNEVD